jgi:hypothetical protein
MANFVANVDILTDTFNTWVVRTNEVIDLINDEVITANSTAGVTGSTLSPRNAVLIGSFTANTLSSNTLTLNDNFSINSTAVSIGTNMSLIANNSAGGAGRFLASNDAGGIYWATATGTGTVSSIANSAGITLSGPLGPGGTLVTTGTIGIRAGDGIVVDSRGVSINTQFVQSLIPSDASTLLGRTWAAPAAIGSTTANTGNFTTVTAGLTTGYRLANDPVFLINNTTIRTSGFVDATTPGISTTGAIRARGTTGGVAYIQFTDSLGSTEWGNFKAHANGYNVWSSSFNSPTLSSTNLTATNANFTNAAVLGTLTKGGQNVLSLGDFANGSAPVDGGVGYWVRLPNGMLLQWGTAAIRQDSTTTVIFPTAFATNQVAAVVSGGVRNNNTGAGENPATVTSVTSTFFTFWQTENVTTTGWWMAMGF